jgi:hypothetical protein
LFNETGFGALGGGFFFIGKSFLLKILLVFHHLAIGNFLLNVWERSKGLRATCQQQSWKG